MYKILIYLLVSIGMELASQDLINVIVLPEKDTFGRLNFYDVCENDLGYYAVGAQTSIFGQCILVVAKIGYDGKLIWKKDFRKVDQAGLEYIWYCERISYAKDGGCYVFGFEKSPLGLKGLFLKVSKNGLLDWSIYIDCYPPGGTGSSYNQSDLITDKEGNAVLVGADIINSWIGKVVKINSSGTILFNKSFNSKDDYVLNLNSITQTKSGDYILVGPKTTEDFRNGKDQLALFKISNNGIQLWNKNYFTGYWDRGDSIRAYPYSVTTNKENEIIIAGQVKKGSISNNQAFILICDSIGSIKKNVLVYENKYPGHINSNFIDKVYSYGNHNIYNFREGNFNLYGVDLENYSKQSEILQAGYSEFPIDYNRRFEFINKYGQAVFVGGGRFYIGDYQNGLVLTTTLEGLWIPPTLIHIDTQTLYPRLVSHSKPHIGVNRIIEISHDSKFSNVVYSKEVSADTSFLQLNTLIPGIYYLRLGTKGRFGNVVYTNPINYKLEKGYRYATRVLGYSSEYSSTDWSASRCLYNPDVYPRYGDDRNAWASSSPDGQREFLYLGFDNPHEIKAIVIYETLNPGAIDSIYAKNPNTQQWILLHSRISKAENPVSRAWKIEFSPTNFPVSEIRIAINSPSVSGYNEIDAVGLVDIDFVNTKELKITTFPIKGTSTLNNKLIIYWNDEFLNHEVKIHIRNLFGQEIYNNWVQIAFPNTEIDLTGFLKGIYVLTIENNNCSKSELFIK